MSEYTIKNETAGTAALQPTDAIGFIEASSGRYKYMLGNQVKAMAFVTVSSTAVTLSAATHAGAVLQQTCSSPWVITLPASAGTGNVYRILYTVNAATQSKIIRNNSSEVFSGFVQLVSGSSAAAGSYATTATDNVVQLYGSSQGANAPGYWEFIDLATNLWYVQGKALAASGFATPFAHT